MTAVIPDIPTVAEVASQSALRPPLKWAGGKRWLVPRLMVAMADQHPKDLHDRGEKRAEAAAKRSEAAKEAARQARKEAEDAPSERAAVKHLEEADLHERAAEFQRDAEALQRWHAAEHDGDDVASG